MRTNYFVSDGCGEEIKVKIALLRTAHPSRQSLILGLKDPYHTRKSDQLNYSVGFTQ